MQTEPQLVNPQGSSAENQPQKDSEKEVLADVKSSMDSIRLQQQQSIAAKEWKQQKRKVNTLLVKDLIARLLTRNNEDAVQRNADRLQVLKNIQNIGSQPDTHIAACMRIIHKRSEDGHPASFEAGIVMGAAIVMATQTIQGEGYLRKMLADIATQQEKRKVDKL